jgi:hypothetical protein
MSYIAGFNSTIGNSTGYAPGAIVGYFLSCADSNGSFKWVPLGTFAVTDILAVANQTTVTDDSKGVYTIGTVQDINTTSSPTFNTVNANINGNLNGNLTAANPVISGDLLPNTDGVRMMGTSSNKFNGIYALNFYGNATSANSAATAITALGVSDPIQYFITSIPSLDIAGKFTNINTNPTIGANLLSLTNNTYDIGASGNIFKNIYAAVFIGSLTGNVTGNVTGNLTGNVTGNCSGTSASVTASTQSAITTLPNLTTINGQSISGTDLAKIVGITNGTAASDKALVLDSSGNIAGIIQLGTDYILVGAAGTSITPNIVFAAAAADSGIYATSSNQIGISISKFSKLLAKSTGVDINGTLTLNGSQLISNDLAVSGNLFVTGSLTLGSFTVTTLNATTLNSTTINNSGTGTITTVNADNYRTQSTSTSLSTSSKHQFNQSVNANDNNVNNYLPYFEVAPVTTILGDTQHVIGLYNQSRFNPAITRTLANGYGEFIGLIHNGQGTTTNLSSIYIADMYKASGTVTNNVALRIEEQTQGTNNWSMYSGGLHQFYRLNSIADTVIINNTNTTTGSATRLLNMYGQSTSQGVYHDLGRTNTSELRIGIASTTNQFAPGSTAGNACITAPGTGRILLGSDGTETAPLILGKSSATYPVAIYNGITLSVTNFGFLSSGGAGNIVGSQSWPIGLYIDRSVVCNQQIMVTSDFRVKSQIRNITNDEIDKFLTITAKNFIKGDSTDPVYGFISQDFCKVGLLDCTDTVPKEGIEEHIDEDNFKSPAGALITLHNEGITALLHATIKRQQEQINTLQTQLNSVLEILARNNIV